MSSTFLVNHAGIMQRIIAIIQSYLPLYNPGDPTNRLRKVKFAEPDEDITDDSTPYAFVQWDTDYETTRESLGTQNSNNLPVLVAYNIVVMVQKKGIAQTTLEISRFLDLLVPLIKSYPTLTDPANPGATPLVFRSNVVSVSRRQQQRGQAQDGAVIKLVCQVGAFWTLTLPSPIGLLNCLSVPTYNDDLLTDIDKYDDMTRVISPKDQPGEITVEFESTQTIDAQLKTMKGQGMEIAVTLAFGAISRTVTAVMTGFHKPVQFDNIERTSLSFEVVQ